MTILVTDMTAVLYCLWFLSQYPRYIKCLAVINGLQQSLSAFRPYHKEPGGNSLLVCIQEPSTALVLNLQDCCYV